MTSENTPEQSLMGQMLQAAGLLHCRLAAGMKISQILWMSLLLELFLNFLQNTLTGRN